MKGDTENNSKSHSFWSRKVSILHIVYLVIICLIVFIFLLCIVPGRINENAYQNFSFAATITSIVLAVVSIVYSLQSGLSSIGQLNGIKDIEAKIGTELTRFSNLETSIKEAVKEGITPLEASMGSIQQRQDDLQKSQDDLSRNWKELMQGTLQSIESSTETPSEQPKQDTLWLTSDTPQIFSVILFACLCSKEHNADIPYHILGKYFGKYRFYCEGVVKSLSIFNPSALKVKEGSQNGRQGIEFYDDTVLGTKEWLKKQIREGKNPKLGMAIIDSLEDYYEGQEIGEDSVN